MNVLCKFGIHKPDKGKYLCVHKRRGKHKWHRNYVVCSRCGKRIATMSVHRKVGENG